MIKLNSLNPGAIDEISEWGSLIKFSHTIFALPFALCMFVVVSRDHTVNGAQLFWIILAMVSARTAAMGYNRYLDRDVDAKNPRTESREIPAGKVSIQSVSTLIVLSTLVFLLSSWQLGMHCLVLAPLVLLVLFFYSWTKRFTQFSHLVLGLALGLAPGGVWYALTGEWSLSPVSLVLAVLFWVAGFDILYSCQDVSFDRQEGLCSIPAQIGIEKAFWLSRLFHLIATVFLGLFGYLFQLGAFYYLGVFVFAGFLVSQHRLVSPVDLSRIDLAFFTRNGTASIVFLLAVFLDSWLAG